MKRSSIIIFLLISMLLFVACIDKPTAVLKGFYQSKAGINGQIIQLSVDNRENTFVLYIDSRKVNSGAFEKEADNLYKMNGDIQEFTINLNNDNSFDIIVTGVSNDFPIKMENISSVPTYFPTSYGDENEYKQLLFNKFNSPELEYDNAYENCIEYIRNSSFDSWKNINILIVKSQMVTETVKEYVIIEKGKDDLLDTTDLIYTVGDTSGHNFANIVCDSETYEVIGYIPTE